jgi:Predicted acetyltransferase
MGNSKKIKIPTGYSIEIASSAHAPLLGAIEIAATTRFPPGTIPDHIRSDSVPIPVLLDAVANGTLWVALDAFRQPVGYALLQIVDGVALLAQMDVLPEHGRKGLGAALVMSIAGFLRDQNKNALYLTTFTHVPWNAPFYASIGFYALNEEEQPPFIKDILNEERQYGLPHRVAMRLPLQEKD